MEKLVFTIQMFALIALFPVYLVAELNHKTAKLPVDNTSSAVIEKKLEIEIQPALIDVDSRLPFLFNNSGLAN